MANPAAGTVEMSSVGGTATTDSTSVETGRAKKESNTGMGVLVTALFIVGETAGAGLIAMPSAMIAPGLYGGLALIAITALLSIYTGCILAENLNILRKRWPEEFASKQGSTRAPYAAMGRRSYGRIAERLVAGMLNLTQFGTAVVFLLLAAKNIQQFLRHFAGVNMSFCWLVVIVALILFPLTLLRSPKDFWWAVVLAMLTTTAAVGLIIYGALEDRGVCAKEAELPPVNVARSLMSWGTAMFAYGGHAAFPTIQLDMRHPNRFAWSVTGALLVVTAMYVPVTVIGYTTYGSSVGSSVIPSLQSWPVQQAVNGLITIHVLLALTIIMSPLHLAVEETVGVSHKFGLGRLSARGGVLLGVVLAALTVPEFGVLLDLVGGSTVTALVLVFPALFHVALKAAEAKNAGAPATPKEEPPTWAEIMRYNPKWRLAVNALVIVLGLAVGIGSTRSGVDALANSTLSKPCFSSMIFGEPDRHDLVSSAASAVNVSVSALQHGIWCCGRYSNVSRVEDAVCLFSSISHGAVVGGSGHHI